MLIYNRTEKNGVNRWVKVLPDGSAIACEVGLNLSIGQAVDNKGTKYQTKSWLPRINEMKLDFSGEVDLKKKAREFCYGTGN